MITEPPKGLSVIGLIPAIFGSVPIYLLRICIINPFLAATTVFPFVILIDGTVFQKQYSDFLNLLTNVLFHRTLEAATTADLLSIFFGLLLLLELFLGAIEKLLKHFNVLLSFDWKYAVGVMTVVYGATWLFTRNRVDAPESIFFLMLYLFNVYSIFGYHILAVAFEKFRLSNRILGKTI
jgi:hypothetical protein